MASPMVLSAGKRSALSGWLDVRRISKPRLSLLILVATSLVIALVLLIWLLLWISRTRAGIEGWWIAQRGLTAPSVGYQGEDLRRLVRPGSKAPSDVSDRAFAQALRARLAGAGRRPVVVYLSAVGVADDQGAFLLRPEPGSLQAFAPSGAREGLITPERLVEVFAQSSSSKKLLILDAAQVGSDRDLGVYANAFVHRVQACLAAKPSSGLVILSSCAPGQTSWSSEADRGSVFGHYVARGMAGAATGWDPGAQGLTVRGLGRYVRYHVERWARANRQAEQTPVLLGDPSVNFPLRLATASRTPPAPVDDKESERLLARLHEGWTRRDALEARNPHRHSPLLWRRYLATLLRAERRIRAGEHGEAAELLDPLPSPGKGIVDAAGGLPFGPHPSPAPLGPRPKSHPPAS